jgi:hypothetical protein
MRNRKQLGAGDELLDRSEILRLGVALAGASSLAFGGRGRAAAAQAGTGSFRCSRKSSKPYQPVPDEFDVRDQLHEIRSDEP